MIGTQLAQRYEIMSQLGSGGMALVYRAHDILLNRQVAIKVLRKEFVHDEEFIRRFRQEAQSAAALSHSNIVSIHDVGVQNDIYYIVMEWIDGQNLSERIRENAPLQVEEAVHIASQICEALEHAHFNNIIHRDIKPHNILIGKNGRIKVTDFGIARAATASSITQTGSVLGSVHYFSPEHAKGVHVSAQSDLYSLGIVLYQMVTGALPFQGESPISVALMHLQDSFVEPRVLNPLIPQSLENIILRSLRKQPEERFASARQMLHELEHCLSYERMNEPKLEFAQFDDDLEQTRVVPAIKQDLRFGPNGEIIPPSAVKRTTSQPSTTGSARERESDGNSIDQLPPKKSKIWPKVAMWIGTFAISILILWLGFSQIRDYFMIDEVTVPDVVNMSVVDAERKLREFELIPKIEMIYDENVDKDVVISQNPRKTNVNINSTVTLQVSQGARVLQMENYIDKNIKTVQQTLDKKYGINIEEQKLKIEEKESEKPPGTVIEQFPLPGDEFEVGKSRVLLYVSKGLPTVLMPDLIGVTRDEAVARLSRNSLKLGPESIIEEPDYRYEKGVVFSQLPAKDTQIKKNEEVKMFVSSGYPPDTRVVLYELPVEPSAEGVKSVIKIKYSDARGDNILWGDRTITTATTLPIKIVMSPLKDGLIEVFRDNVPVGAEKVLYNEADEKLPPPVEELIEETPVSEGPAE